MRIVNPTELVNWDSQVGSFPGCTFFHGAAWTEVMQRSYGHRALYLVAESAPGQAKGPGGKDSLPTLAGVLPLMEIDSPLTGRRGVCLPYSDTCAPLIEEGSSWGALFQAALELGRRRRWRYLEVRGGDLPEGGQPSTTFLGHRLRLVRQDEEVMARFAPSMRQAIRKAQREGVSCSIERTLEALRSFYRLHCLTRRRHGVPPQPFCFFENILASVLSKGHGFVVLARWSGQAVAGAVFFCHGSKAVFKYGASDLRRQELRGSGLAMAEGIKWLCRNGFDELDFGRTALGNEGLQRFKRAFGAREGRIDYVKFDFKQDRFVRQPESDEGWLSRVVRKMPAPVCRLAGRLLYPHVEG